MASASQAADQPSDNRVALLKAHNFIKLAETTLDFFFERQLPESGSIQFSSILLLLHERTRK